MLKRDGSGEQGFAIVTAILVLIVVAGLLAVIAMAARGTKDRARDRLDRAVGNAPVDDGIATYLQALNSGNAGRPTAAQMLNFTTGEYNGYRLPRQALQSHATEAGGTVIANSSGEIPPSMRTVDPSVPAADRFTVKITMPGNPGVFRYWHLYALQPPRYGTTAGAKIVAYFRGWAGTGVATSATKPVLVRAEFRPGRFADYQLLADGKIQLGAGAVINGKVHSNGFNSSLDNQYAAIGEQIGIQAGASCSATARITTTSGAIADSGAGCAGKLKPDTGELVNLLRVKDAIARMRALCNQPGLTVRVQCFNNAPVYNVNIGGSGSAPGGTAVTVNTPTGSSVLNARFGTVLVFDNRVNVRGVLGGNARLTIATSTRPGAPSTQFGGPSIWFQNTNNVGSNGTAGNSVGMIAEGDVIADHTTSCPLTVRGAVIAASGVFSYHPTWRSRFFVGNGTRCPGELTVNGSLSGHYPPASLNEGNNAGYSSRDYQYSPFLFDNPPPMFPTTGNWDMLDYENADLDCFNPTNGQMIAYTTMPAKCR